MSILNRSSEGVAAGPAQREHVALNRKLMNFTNRFSQCLQILYGSFLFVVVLRF